VNLEYYYDGSDSSAKKVFGRQPAPPVDGWVIVAKREPPVASRIKSRH